MNQPLRMYVPQLRSSSLSSIIAGCAAPHARAASRRHRLFDGKADPNRAFATRALAALNANNVPVGDRLCREGGRQVADDAGVRALLGNAYFAGGRFRSAEAAYQRFADARSEPAAGHPEARARPDRPGQGPRGRRDPECRHAASSIRPTTGSHWRLPASRPSHRGARSRGSRSRAPTPPFARTLRSPMRSPATGPRRARSPRRMCPPASSMPASTSGCSSPSRARGRPGRRARRRDACRGRCRPAGPAGAQQGRHAGRRSRRLLRLAEAGRSRRARSLRLRLSASRVRRRAALQCQPRGGRVPLPRLRRRRPARCDPCAASAVSKRRGGARVGSARTA